MSALSEMLIDRARCLGIDAEIWNSTHLITETVCRNGSIERRVQERRDATAVTTWSKGREGYAVQAPVQNSHLVDQALAVGEALGAVDIQPPTVPALPPALDLASAHDNEWDKLPEVLSVLAQRPEGIDIEFRARADRYHIELHRTGGLPGQYQTATFSVQARLTVRRDGVGFLSHVFHGARGSAVLAHLARELDDLIGIASLLGQESIDDIRYDHVLVDGRVMSLLLDLAVPALGLDTVLEGRSLFADRIGERVTVSGLSLIDDPSAADAPLPAPWDDEGTPTRRSVLVDDGVLQGYLSSRRTAGARGTDSSGNGWRSSDGGMPTVQHGHLTLRTANDIGRPRRHGRTLYIVQANGAHISNNITGEFSIGANALIVEPSVYQRNAGLVTVAGNVFDMLMNIEGSDGKVHVSGGDRSFIACPGLWVTGLSIGR